MLVLLWLLVTTIIVYFATTLFGYVVHWSLHQKWMGRIRKTHLTHHRLYHGNDYVSSVYRDAGEDNTVKLFILPSLVILAVPVVLYIVGIVPLYIMIVALAEMLALGYILNYLHDSFHIDNHFLPKNKYIRPLFVKMSQHHFMHHNKVTKNFGICTDMWDRLFGTLK